MKTLRQAGFVEVSQRGSHVKMRNDEQRTAIEAQDSPGRILNLWHWHLGGSPRVPKTAWTSSQFASLAGKTVTSDIAAASVTRTRYCTMRLEREASRLGQRPGLIP